MLTPWFSLAAHASGAECPAQSGTCSIGASYSIDPAKQSSHSDDKVVKAGMMSAERALNSMKTEISATCNICEGRFGLL